MRRKWTALLMFPFVDLKLCDYSDLVQLVSRRNDGCGEPLRGPGHNERG